ncbi:glycosyl transferase group 1 [Candidatus Scalindua japonica]|uniref:Glycosyl transferase group 1 n=1 Tax=Candidatus Scalindua japonica TaxID=1284222 RepID=A0A286TWM0_9BACT|nr:glycosyltransferase family 4 protein [Candidatus Scalindua japonica]GAX60274.1 glycosyl transferase group 1 [Candidatus Scalindua japonica]
MKIALNIYKYLPTKGGGEGYLANFANQLVERGHEVHVFASKWESNNKKIHYHTIPSIRYPKFLKDVSFVVNGRREMAKYDFDIVHVVGRALGMNVFNPHCGVEKAWLKQDLLSVRCPYLRLLKRIITFFSFRQNYILWLDRKQYTGKGVSRIIAISDMIKNDIIRYHDIDPHKIDVVYNGVDLRRFNPDNKKEYRAVIRSKLSLGEEFIILYISNNFRLKGLSTLIMSLGELKKSGKDFKALIIGRGNDTPYRKLAKKLDCQENLMFLGHVGGIEKYYAASDLYVHPTFFDSCSLVVTESLASGLPVITTKYDGASGVMEDGREGFVMKRPEDHRELAEKISLFFDDEFRQKASISAREKAEKYPAEKNCDEIIKIFNEVASRNKLENQTF